MSVADRIAAKVASLRPKYEDVALPDWCQVIRTVPGVGFNAPATTRVVESTRCVLSVSERSGTEDVAADQLAGITVYTCDLPYDTLARDTDTLKVNGREFGVVSVAWEEGFAIGRTALLEART